MSHHPYSVEQLRKAADYLERGRTEPALDAVRRAMDCLYDAIDEGRSEELVEALDGCSD